MLREWVEKELRVAIDTIALGEQPSLRHVRSVRLSGPTPRLLLHPDLTPSQRAYVLAREIRYHRLGLKARSNVSPPDAESSFDQVLNDFKSSYFAGAVVIPSGHCAGRFKRLFRQPRWHAGIPAQPAGPLSGDRGDPDVPVEPSGAGRTRAQGPLPEIRDDGGCFGWSNSSTSPSSRSRPGTAVGNTTVGGGSRPGSWRAGGVAAPTPEATGAARGRRPNLPIPRRERRVLLSWDCRCRPPLEPT